MSGTHGDCAPDSGCTDCPTCRGEVRPDATVMHDLAFGTAMATGPQATDPFFGPLRIAQTVRDGARSRGGRPGLERLVLVVGDDLSGGPVALLVTAPQSVARRADAALHDLESRGGPSQSLLPDGGGGRGSPRRRRGGESGIGSPVRCCVTKFCYPQKVQIHVDRDVPNRAYHLVITFDAKAVYRDHGASGATTSDSLVAHLLQEAEKKAPGSTYGPNKPGEPTPPPDLKAPEKLALKCSCPCCTFEQRIELKRISNTARVDKETGKQPSPFDLTSDCIWFKPPNSLKKFWNQPTSPGEEWELLCPGRTGKSELGQKEIKEKWSKSKCRYEFTDISSWAFRSIYLSIEVAWEGRIWDRCRMKIRRVKTFSVAFSITEKAGAGGASISASITVDGKTSEVKPSEQNRSVYEWINPDKECK